MPLSFTTSLKNDGNFRNTFQKVHFQGHLWKENVASLLEEWSELVGTDVGGRDGVTSTRGAAGSSSLGVCRDLVMKPALLAAGLYVCIYTCTHTYM